MSDLRGWTSIDTGRFAFNPVSRLPSIVVSRDDGTGPVHVVNPAFGTKVFDSHGEAQDWLAARGFPGYRHSGSRSEDV